MRKSKPSRPMSAIWSEPMRSLKGRRTGEETTSSRRRRSWTVIAILAVAVTGAARAEDEHSASRGSIQAKLSYCKDCHGPSAQGYRGYFPIPRLAGQQTEYLENQLRAFIEHRRTNNVMFNVAHALSPSMISALAASFRDLNPAPIGGAPRQLVAEGRRIYQDGV